MVYEKLLQIQSKLKVPKGQYNEFGKYKYRSCEDILEALKPLLAEVKAAVILNDEIVQVGERIYVKATASFIDIEDKQTITTTAYAREEETKKGMDGSQITGASSSYARKYALNGLFAIDDNKDSDATNNQGEGDSTGKPNTSNKSNAELSEAQVKRLFAIAYSAGINKEKVEKQVKGSFKKDVKDLNRSEYDQVCNGYEKLKKNK
jgi:hypothetical protein